jgi:hypothetical protein
MRGVQSAALAGASFRRLALGCHVPRRLIPAVCCPTVSQDEVHDARSGAFAICCKKGSAVCPTYEADDQPALLELLASADYRTNIRAYNSVFQMASSTANPTVLASGVQQVYVTVQHQRYCVASVASTDAPSFLGPRSSV